jgi:hypothetical protein
MKTTGTLLQNLRTALERVAERLMDVATGHEFAPVPVRRDAAVVARRIFPALALIAVSATFASSAHASFRDDGSWANGRLVDVQIQVDGEGAPLYWSPSNDDRRYFQAFAGRNYSVVLRNNTSRRVGVLLAVDGINAVNGERTDLRAGEAMYVLNPWESATIRGWRTSLQEVRRFVFVDEARSYAERTGQANGDMGWIRVLTFNEQRPWWSINDKDTRWGQLNNLYRDGGQRAARPATPEEGAQPATPEDQAQPTSPEPQANREDAAPPSANGKPMAKRMASGLTQGDERGSFPGTGWGERRSDPVTRVQFNPERTATDHLVFRYEYASGLRALGIFPDRDRLRERDGGGELGFAKPPRR